jgi:cyclic pyranopterin monophosphate synthase
MRDISSKASTLRTAVARATLTVGPAAMDAVRAGAVPKGNPLEVAKVAAIQAAKGTSLLIPYCHPIPIDHVGVEFALGDETIEVTATVKAIAKTGVEMEALTAASVAALTLYDMLKMLDRSMEIRAVRLIEKHGGKSSFSKPQDSARRAAVLVLSDSIAAGERDDVSGKLIAERLSRDGLTVVEVKVLPDDLGRIVETLKAYADDLALDLVVTTGGTGFGPRDVAPEATAQVIERTAPGIPEAVRAHGQERTPYAMLSRGAAGIRGKTLIINLPGSSTGVAESLDALFPGVLHAFAMIAGGGHEPHERDAGKEAP